MGSRITLKWWVKNSNFFKKDRGPINHYVSKILAVFFGDLDSRVSSKLEKKNSHRLSPNGVSQNGGGDV